MSFLDNLENSLKSLESRDEQSAADSNRKRHEERAQSLAIAPWAEKLKQSEFVDKLLMESTAVGRQLRAKVYMSWLDGTLRLEARGSACELKPTASGIIAEYQRLSDNSRHTEAVDLAGEPAALLQRWLLQ